MYLKHSSLSVIVSLTWLKYLQCMYHRMEVVLGLVYGCLTPLSTKFQLYRGSQFYKRRKIEYPGENHRPAVSHRNSLASFAFKSYSGSREHERIKIKPIMKTSQKMTDAVMTIAHMAFEPGEFINKLLTYILHITN